MTPHQLVVRVFHNGVLVETHVIEEPQMEANADGVCERWKEAFDQGAIMVEVEFLGAPEEFRFARFGTDPCGMVEPMAIDPVTETVDYDEAGKLKVIKR